MSRDTLWAPWRLDYIVANKGSEGARCFLCEGWAGEDDRAHYVLWRGSKVLVVLNRFPYNNGHLLVAPAAHKAGLEDLEDDEMLELMHSVRQMKCALDRLLQPQGYNVGLNLGSVAGAGLPGHLHWHIVPRWNGDTNFMPVLADTRVIVQSLESLFDLLRAEL